MKDIPLFDTETGVSTLVLKEIPYRQTAYIRVQSVQPGGLEEHLRECAAFCRMCGAEKIYAAGHPELAGYPLHCRVLVMSRPLPLGPSEDTPEPVTAQTVAQWREIYNERMSGVDNAATLTARDEKDILQSRNAWFVRDGEALLGIGWLRGSEVLAVASVRRGAGERVLAALLTKITENQVTLEVASTNARAIVLYERMGFRTALERSSWHHIT